MTAVRTACLLLLLACTCGALPEEQYHQLPRLFHLDEHDACLSQPRSLYCLGSFQLQPATHDLTLYTTLQEQSSRITSFNHTLLHRGYCVYRRCPELASGPDSDRHKFASCVAREALRTHALRTRLIDFQYCERPGRPRAARSRTIFVVVVVAVLAANVLGTCYDVTWTDETRGAGSSVLLAWSVRRNWRRLVCAGPASGMRVLDDVRALLTVPLVVVHALFVSLSIPARSLEFLPARALRLLASSTVSVQLYAVTSSLLLRAGLLRHLPSSAAPPLPVRVLLSRLARIAPAYWLVLAAAAAWWDSASSGPRWAALVGREARACRAGWWERAMFLRGADGSCLLPAWFLSTDLQLHTAMALLLYLRGGRGGAALWWCTGAAATLLALYCAVQHNLRELVFVLDYETLRNKFADNQTFSWMYTSWWGNLAASAAGAAVAEKLHDEPVATQAGGRGPLVYSCLVLLWLCAGVWAAEQGGPVAEVLYTTLARPVTAVLIAGLLCALCRQYPGGLLRGRWATGARFVSRVSLGVSLLHWPLNVSLVALRGGDVSWVQDSAAVWAGAVLGAGALTVLLQYPVQNTLRATLPRYF